MNLENYKKIYNLYYGNCYILKEKEKCYLVYVENYKEHYIVCSYIDTTNALMEQTFFNTLEEATEYYNKN